MPLPTVNGLKHKLVGVSQAYLRASTSIEHDWLATCALAGITSQALHHLIGGDTDSGQVTALQPVGLALNHMDAAGPQVGQPLL